MENDDYNKHGLWWWHFSSRNILISSPKTYGECEMKLTDTQYKEEDIDLEDELDELTKLP